MTRIFPGAALVVCTLAGCADGNPALRKNPSFQEGYEDGCQAATDEGADLRGRTVGDEQLLKTDDAYRAGYGNGLRMCRRTNGETGTLPGTRPPLVPEPGGGP
jgi:hypothetical protein